jgi:hypothetical protein
VGDSSSIVAAFSCSSFRICLKSLLFEKIILYSSIDRSMEILSSPFTMTSQNMLYYFSQFFYSLHSSTSTLKKTLLLVTSFIRGKYYCFFIISPSRRWIVPRLFYHEKLLLRVCSIIYLLFLFKKNITIFYYWSSHRFLY